MRTDDRDRLRTPGGSFLAALVIFVLIAAAGLMLFLTAFVLWMATLTGSLVAGVLITGGCCALVAAAIYGWGLRPQLSRMQEQIETVYEVARAARCGYEWVVGKVTSLLRPREGNPET